MIVIWTPEAEQDRLDIWNHIEPDNPAAAARMDVLFSETAARLADVPFMGKPGQIPGTQEFIPHPSYRLVYAVNQDTIWILALVHTARLWP